MEDAQREIVVVERDMLFGRDYFEGFMPKTKNGADFELRIVKGIKYMKKNLAEHSPSYKHPIVYCLVVNPGLKQVFAYQRSKKDKHYSEKRLQGKWSVGVGGHIEKVDLLDRNPIQKSMLRELDEEIQAEGGKSILDYIAESNILGYINNDSNDVGKVHFGLLYIINTNSREVKPRSQEMANGRLRTLSELEKMAESKIDFEDWSKIALNPLKNILKS